MNPDLRERVSERFEKNTLVKITRNNEIILSEKTTDMRHFLAGFENFLLLPGMFIVYLQILSQEWITTLRFRTQERTEKTIEAKDLWDMDLRDISPVTRDLEDWRPVRLQNSMNGIPTWPNGQWFDYLRDDK